MLKTEKVRKKISDVSPSIPRARPVSRVVPASATPLFASSVALEVSSAPASLTHPSTRSTASETPASISDDCSAMPLKTSRKMTTPSAINAEEHENGAADPRYSVLLHLRDDRTGDGGEDGAHRARARRSST